MKSRRRLTKIVMNHVKMTIHSEQLKRIAKQKLEGNWFKSAFALILLSVFLLWNNQIYFSIIGIVSESFFKEDISVDTIFTIFGLYILPFIGPFLVGAAKYFLDIAQNREAKFTNFFYGFNFFWRSMKQFLLYSLIIGIPLLVLYIIQILKLESSFISKSDAYLVVYSIVTVLLILAGIIYTVFIQITLFFSFFVIADENIQYQGALSSFYISASMMKNNMGHLFRVMISFLGWYLLAMLPGILLTMGEISEDSIFLASIITIIPTSFVYAYAYATLAVYYRILIGELEIDTLDELYDDSSK